MGGDPNSERGQAWVNKVAGLFPCENFKGLRVWQGKIDPKILAAMAKMPPKWRILVLSSHTEFERCFGRPAGKRRKLYNGMLKCDVFMYP